MALGRPAIPTPNRLDLRATQDSIAAARQRIEFLEAAVNQLQLVPAGTAAALVQLQAQVARLLTLAGAGSISPSQFGAQAAGAVLVGPLLGANAVPTFRELEWHFDLPLLTSAPYTSAIEGDEAILVERYGQILYTTLNDLLALARQDDRNQWFDFDGDATLVPADAGNGLRSTGNSGVQYLTIPEGGFVMGDTVLVHQAGGAQVQFVRPSGLPDLQYRAVYDPRTADENSLVTLRYQGDEQWLLSGDLEAA